MAMSMRPPQALEGAGAIGEDFPIVCDPCLGGNPYIRMLKGTMGKECRISGRPFNSFRWQGAHNKWKETVIAPEVAREKNCCMACLNDLEYGVPFHVRDGLLDALGTDMAPESAVNKEFWWANKRQKQEDEGAHAGLDTYGMLRDNVDKLRAFAALDPGPIVRPRRETPLTPEEQERLRQRRLMEQKPPDDTSITSLYIGSVPPTVTKRDLMPYMMAYGELRDLVVDAGKLCAYVTFQRRADAEKACKALHNNLSVKNTRLRVMWARRGKARTTSRDEPEAVAGAGGSAQMPPPPPTAGSAKRARPPPPGVRLPPGVKPYASMTPGASGANPSAHD
mmetsp:Transcript_30607/g.72163  ORF Transcript_30607/g.72163 Transcript_30607/m.72163 type:complete len:336 (-) Transcript_30607:112-1119(-)